MADEFTHLTDSGVHMVEVGNKPDQKEEQLQVEKYVWIRIQLS